MKQTIATPYYLIDETLLQRNLEIIQTVSIASHAKSLLALKCFATWGVFPLMHNYLDGTTSSSLFEARLGHETFGKETHAYSVAFSPTEVKKVKHFADKIIFNSISQLEAYQPLVSNLKLGLRINPGISYSHYDLADPARRYSRLGVQAVAAIERVIPLISGLMFHFNCENDNVEQFATALEQISTRYATILKHMEWVSLGGGLAFTQDGYPIERFIQLLRTFAEQFTVQVYLEPGEAAITNCAELVTTVLDVVQNEIDIVIVDASIEAHTLDHLIYHTQPKLTVPPVGTQRIMLAGRSCLAGDVFGEYNLAHTPAIGSEIRIADAAGYTMVKKNWFNGLAMPAIVVRRLDGRIEKIRAFKYRDFKCSLS